MIIQLFRLLIDFPQIVVAISCPKQCESGPQVIHPDNLWLSYL